MSRLSFLVAFGLATSICPAQSSAVQWAAEKVFKRVKIYGYRWLGYHAHTITGDKEAYGVTNYGGLGNKRFTDLGFLRLEGQEVFGWLNFEANLQDARFEDPQAQRYRLWTKRGPWSIEHGDINASLGFSNQYARFNKSVTGTSIAYDSKGFQAKIVTSAAKGQVRTVTIQGANTAGPYYLQSSQIIRGSEKIEVDGVLQEFGRDYTIDYDLGAVTFVDRVTLAAKVIPPTSTIVASYESLAYNSSPGTVQGASLAYDFGKAGRLGVTAVRQLSGSAGGNARRTDRFQGFGPPSTPYFLQFEPLLTQPVEVRVDGVLQVEGVDFHFDPNNPSIFYFERFMPATALIDVEYTPKPTGVASGDREVVGFDYQLPLGKAARLNLSQATGKTRKTAIPQSGNAVGASLRGEVGPWQYAAGLRRVDDNFVGIETTSFSRNEKAHDFSIRRSMGQAGAWSLSSLNAVITGLATNTSTAPTRTRFTRTAASYELPAGRGLPILFTLARNTTQNPANTTNIDSASLSTSKTFGKATAQLSLENQHVTGTQPADIFGLNLRTTYQSSDVWSFVLGTSLSNVRGNASSGLGRELSLSATYKPSDKFLAVAKISDGSAGNAPDLGGISTGYGAGYNGNGFSSGSGSFFFNGPTNGKTALVALDWDVSDRLQVNAAGRYYRSTGNFGSNAETTSGSLGIDYDLGAGHQLSAYIDASNTKFIGATENSSAMTLNANIVGTPAGRFSYRAGVSALVSGGSSTFQQDSFAWDLDLNYTLAPRHQLGFQANNGSVYGYLPQTDIDMSLVYRYQIWRSLSFNASYRFRDVQNKDPLVTSGAYRSAGFDFELAFNFAG